MLHGIDQSLAVKHVNVQMMAARLEIAVKKGIQVVDALNVVLAEGCCVKNDCKGSVRNYWLAVVVIV